MNDNEEVVISKMMLPHLGLPLTDVTWHVNVTFGVGAGASSNGREKDALKDVEGEREKDGDEKMDVEEQQRERRESEVRSTFDFFFSPPL